MGEEATGLLGLDWGTTSLRTYRIGHGGTVLERRAHEVGILRVKDDDFAGALQESIGDWLLEAPYAPVIASGMIGSRQGWLEVPYLPCPAGLAEIARGLGTVDGPSGRIVHIVPGLLRPAGEAGFPDVMRGEETQILGERHEPSGCYVLPGTHSKWATCSEGRIVDFATYMTGEVFDVLRQHSILGRLMSGQVPDDAAFARGLERARGSAGAPPGRLLHDLFSARTLGLTDMLPPAALASYLSGLLIGSEILAALGEVAAGPVIVLGSGTLTELYARAIAALDVAVEAGPADAAAYGLHAIARAANLIEAAPHA